MYDIPMQESVAYCARSQIIFSYEERDVFAGEIFCPHCASRTEPKHRAKSVKVLLKRFPKAKLYRDKDQGASS